MTCICGEDLLGSELYHSDHSLMVTRILDQFISGGFLSDIFNRNFYSRPQSVLWCEWIVFNSSFL